MREKKVLLIYPPNQLMDVEMPRPDGSLGPLYLAAELEKRGVRTDILDASVGSEEHELKNTFYRTIRQENGLIRIGMNFEEIAEYVAKENYSVVGINSNFTPQTKMAFETARAIKKANPEIKIYAGGVNARALKERFLQTNYFDGICLTEGELIFPKMVLEDMKNVPGVAFNDGKRIVVNAVSNGCFPKTLDNLTMPAWEKLPFKKYEEIASPHGVDVTERGSKRYAPIMTSRGCPFKCSYCHISLEKKDTDLTGPIGKLRCHSIERIVTEMEKLKSLGIERLFFEDDSLLADKKRVKEIFRRARNSGFAISDVNGVNLIHFFNLGKTDRSGKWEIDKEYLEILREAGYDQMVFPVESASKRVLKKYATNKIDLERMNLILLMKIMTEMGIRAPINIMIGFPDETEEEIRESIEFSQRLMGAGAPYVTFFAPIPFPGSELCKIAIKESYLDENFNTDVMNWKNPVMKNTVVPPKKIKEIIKEANEKVNRKDYLEFRLKQSAGFRLALEKN